MNLNAILQSSVAKPHLVCLVVLFVASRLLRGRRGARELWIVVVTTSGLVAIGLAFFLLQLLAASQGHGDFIPPIAFAGGFFAAFLAYLLIFVLSLVFRPVTAFTAGISWLVSALGLVGFNAIFLSLPTSAGTTITLRIWSPDHQPMQRVTLSYKTEFARDADFSATSDDSGVIVLHSKLGDTIDGQIAPSPLYGAVKVYISAPKRSGERWGIQRHWSTSFGSADFQSYAFFLSDFDDHSNHVIDVYLPWRDKPQLLPYQQLARLADRLREAQRTGQSFNPELNVQNLESYVQLSEVAHAFDPNSPMHNWEMHIFTYLSEEHDNLEGLLQKITDQKVQPSLRDVALTQLLSLFNISHPDTLTWQEKRALIQQRLDQDLATIKNVPQLK